MRQHTFIFLTFLISLVMFSCSKDENIPAAVFDCVNPYPDSSVNNPSNTKYQDLLTGIKNSGVPGIMMSIRDNQSGMWLGTAGKSDLKSNVDLQSCNISRVGSTVKTFTASTIFLLQEEGKLNLDDQASMYLTSEDIENIENADVATIRQLMQHSSGIYNYIQNLKFQTGSLNDLIKEWSPDELLSYARGKKAYFAPGEDVLYSNTNYVLLGMIITNIEGKPFWKVFEEKIFEPLHLSATSFAATDPVPGNIINGYVDFYSNLNVMNSTYYSGWDYFTADGGLISNAYDLNTFLTALFAGELISENSLTEMMDWRLPNNPDSEFYPVYYGLGIFKMDTPWGSAYFHSGDAIGYYASMVYFPDEETTVTWAVNGNYGAIDEYTQSKDAMDNIFQTVFD